ncbi:MAG: peptidoglycan DD-metalloendopeptidase family protein [Candidatus Omnitrophota bacterium]|nr:MAG: peptidoglycan DD-metalloendopeptidase family protein [Candidatus Omnitrophota bacterium]
MSSYVPGSYSSSSSAGGSRYYVKKGDSLWAISKRYAVSVQRLMKENRISSPKELKEGQILFIPGKHRKSNSGSRRGNGSFSWPLKGEIINFFGERMGKVINRGVDVKSEGSSSVNASADGQVIFCDYLKGWGQTLILKHPSNFYTIYANLADNSVREGSYVKDGEFIGKVASGVDGDCVLHFEIRKKHLPQNPLDYLK